MAIQPSTTRRALFAAALALPALAAGAAIAHEAEWRDLASKASNFHRDGLATVAKARAAGLNPDDLTGMYKASAPGEPRGLYLIFGNRPTARLVSLDGVV